MDPFWGITLSVIAISSFWKRERIKAARGRIHQRKKADEQERIKQEEVIDRYSAIFSEPMTREEVSEEKRKQDNEKERERETERLRKEGYTDELIAVILPTINNGQ